MIISGIIDNIFIQIFYYILLSLIVFALTKTYKLQKPGDFKIKIRSSSLWSIAAIILSFALIGCIIFLSKNNGLDASNKNLTYSFNSVLQIFFLFVIVFSPVYIAIRRNRESLQSIGISRLNLIPSIILAVFLIIIIGCAVFYYKPDLTFAINSNCFWGLIYFAIIGFGEEIVFRGYLQSRLILWLGKLKGWLISSVIFALMHFWQRIFVMNFTPSEALLNIMLLMLPSCFLGFLMLQTNNVVAPGIVHTFMDWFFLFL